MVCPCSCQVEYIANGNTIWLQSCVIILAVNQKSYFLYTKSFNHYSGSQTQLLPMYTHQVLNWRFLCLFLTYAVFKLINVLTLTVFCSIPSTMHTVCPKWAFYHPYILLLVENRCWDRHAHQWMCTLLCMSCSLKTVVVFGKMMSHCLLQDGVLLHWRW